MSDGERFFVTVVFGDGVVVTREVTGEPKMPPLPESKAKHDVTISERAVSLKFVGEDWLKPGRTRGLLLKHAVRRSTP
jgi:hypothetical protein